MPKPVMQTVAQSTTVQYRRKLRSLAQLVNDHLWLYIRIEHSHRALAQNVQIDWQSF